jgi:hypothetical protein
VRSLLDVMDREWIWSRPRLLSRSWELRAGDEVVATLEARSWLGVRMLGETVGGRWDLRHEGLFRGRAVMRREGDDAEHLVFRPRWFGAGDVTGPGGEDLRWKRGDFLGRRWQFVDRDGHVQLEFVRRPAFFKSSTAVAVTDAGRARADMPELVLLGLFLLRLLERQAHAAH